MNNEDTNQSELEKLFHKILKNFQEPADEQDTLWLQIAHKQQPHNAMLKMRYYAVKTGLIIMVLGAAAGIWWAIQQPKMLRNLPAPPTVAPQTIAHKPAIDTLLPAILSLYNTQSTNTPFVATKLTDLPIWVPRNTVPLERIRFYASEGIHYESAISGNEVDIPANALVDAAGNPVQGVVEMYFREYRNCADFLAANIPMHYGDERGQYFFNSGGMIEVRLGQDANELFMAPEHSYQVEFTPTDQLQGANLYQFDDKAQKWDFIPADVFGGRTIAGANGQALPLPVTMQQVIQNNTDGSQQAMNCMAEPIYLGDKENIAEWISDAVYGGKTLAASKQQTPKWLARYAYKTPPPSSVVFDFPSEIEIIFQKDIKTYFFPQDRRGTQTELLAFKDYYFTRTGDSLMNDQPDGVVNTYNVEAILREKRNWTSVEIRNIDGAKCDILLLDGEGDNFQLHSRLNPSRELADKEAFNPATVYATYKQMRQNRLEEQVQKIKKMTRFMRFAAMFQAQEEWCMHPRDWLVYFDKNRAKMLARYDSLIQTGITDDTALAQKIYQQWNKNRQDAVKKSGRLAKQANDFRNISAVLQLTGFGIHNYDQIYRLDKKIAFMPASYQTAQGQPIKPASLRIVDRENRIFLPILSPENMVKLPGRQVDMVLTDIDGNLYYYPGKKYSILDLNNSSTCTFTMENITGKINTPDEWIKLLQL